MTQEEFLSRYRSVFLGWLSEAYCARKQNQSEFGALMDEQYRKLEGLLRKIHNELSQPARMALPSANGKAAKVEEKVVT